MLVEKRKSCPPESGLEHLRLFQGARSEVTYLGEFEYVTHRTEKAGASRGGGVRNVFVFELRRADG